MPACGMLPLFAATDPATSDSAATWVVMILRELGRAQASGFLLDLVKWALLGAGAGVLLATLGCVTFSRLGWYDLRARFACSLRWTVFALTVVLAGFIFGTAGLWQGAVRGSERVLIQSLSMIRYFRSGTSCISCERIRAGLNTC